MKKQKKILNKFTAVVTAMTMLVTTIASGFATPVYTYAVNNKGGSKSSSNATIYKEANSNSNSGFNKRGEVSNGISDDRIINIPI